MDIRLKLSDLLLTDMLLDWSAVIFAFRVVFWLCYTCFVDGIPKKSHKKFHVNVLSVKAA